MSLVNLEYYGVQVKAGNLSGSATSTINEILNQINDIFKVPFIDIDSNQQQYINKVIIAISGEYSNNARLKF